MFEEDYMVGEPAKKNKDWEEYVGQRVKIVYEDGMERDGKTPHMSIKKGSIEKVTKTHMILCEDDKGLVAINLLKILRAEWERSK